MQKINIVAVGNLKDRFFIDAAEEYLKRLSRFARVAVREVDERLQSDKTLKEEAEKIIPALRGFVVVLAVEGEQFSSEQFAEKIKSCASCGQELTFVIGSSQGLDDSVKARADLLLSFSKMTLPHRLMRVVLLEQLYRAFMLNSGSSYHK